MKSWTVEIDGVKHTRSVRDLFANTKDYKEYITLDDDFKTRLENIGANNINFISTKSIKGDKKSLELNHIIFEKIITEQYEGSWFEFLKDSGVVKFDQDKIDESELTSYVGNSSDIGRYGYIIMNTINDNAQGYMTIRTTYAGYNAMSSEYHFRIINLDKSNIYLVPFLNTLNKLRCEIKK